ncbi:hypothetical protein [Candidatus Clostridium helianthi]|uniref:Uncharacterized protein n=1 Tax=Candidatus Clostridium helianthi TaxID=3381660 RepID=A0ABW8S5Z3_9CLOT
MNNYVVVNGIRVPVIRNTENAANRLRAIKRDSIIIISKDCMMPSELLKMLKAKGAKIITVD